jgi:hypothetical protein
MEVQAGNQTAPLYAQPELWSFLDGLPERNRPVFLRGDSHWGTEKAMVETQGQTERIRASLSRPRASLFSFERPRLLVDPNTARFDDPKTTGNRCGLKRRQQAPDRARQQAQRRYSRQAQHSDAGRIVRRESKHVGEVEVQRNQAAALRDADLEQSRVAGSA